MMSNIIKKNNTLIAVPKKLNHSTSINHPFGEVLRAHLGRFKQTCFWMQQKKNFAIQNQGNFAIRNCDYLMEKCH